MITYPPSAPAELTDIGMEIMLPFPARPPTSTSAYLIDAAGEKVAFVCRVPPDRGGNIRKIIFRVGTVTTGQTLKASIQAVGTDGNPDGVVIQSGTVACADTDDNTWKTVTLGSDYTVATGDQFAVVIEFNATVGNLQILSANGPMVRPSYPTHYTTSWAKADRIPLLVFEYDDGTSKWWHGLAGHLFVASGGNTTLEVGNRIIMPFTARVIGMNFNGALAASTSSYIISIYESNTTVMTTATVVCNKMGVTGNAQWAYLFPTPVTLTKGVTYHYGFKSDGTPQINLNYSDAPSASYIASLPMSGNVCYVQRLISGGASQAWTETTTRVASPSLIFDQIAV